MVTFKVNQTTLAAIESHLNTRPGCANFCGVGYGYTGVFPYPVPLVEEDGVLADSLILEIPAAVIWYGVPPENVIQNAPPVRIDLRDLYNACARKGLCQD